MRFANPVLYHAEKVDVLHNHSTHRLIASSIFIRLEPEFIFEAQQVSIEVASELCVYFVASRQISRSTIALFIPFADLPLGSYRVRIHSAERALICFLIDVLVAIDGTESAAAAGKAETKFFRDRYALQSLPFEEMLAAAYELLTTKHALLIYITGSVGKTTTKELLAFALQGRVRVAKSSDSWNFPHEICSQILNNLWADVFIMEASLNPYTESMGRALPPNILVFTEVGTAHTQLSSNLHQIASKKISLAAGMSDSGKIVANVGNSYINQALNELRSPCELVSVSASEATSAQVQVLASETETLVVAHGRRVVFPTLPNHIAPTILGCALAAYLLIDQAPDSLDYFLQKFAEFPPITGRMETIRVGSTEVLNDAYNANPASMRNLFRLLNQLRQQGRTILLILGDMADLGDLTDAMHREIFTEARAVCDCLLVSGENFTAASTGGCGAFSNASDGRLFDFIDRHFGNFDLIALKGSHSSGLFEIGRRLTHCRRQQSRDL